MNKVQIIHAESTVRLQRLINDFIKDKEIISISFTSVHVYSPTNFYALITYKENNKFNKEGTGYWITGVDEAGYEYGTCSACGYVEQDAFPRGDIPNYCSHCGLKMIKKRGR